MSCPYCGQPQECAWCHRPLELKDGAYRDREGGEICRRAKAVPQVHAPVHS